MATYVDGQRWLNGEEILEKFVSLNLTDGRCVTL